MSRGPRGTKLRVAMGTLGAFAATICCGDSSTWSASTSTGPDAGGGVVVQASSGAWPAFFDRIVTAAQTTAFRGTRRVVLIRGGEVFDYLEDVGADGTGRFDVVVPHVYQFPAGLDPVITPILLENRGRFGYRVRDAWVTDLGVLALNWRVSVLSRDLIVAGHPCWRVQLERLYPLATVDVRYQLDVEPRTGFVLGWRESDTQGQLSAEVVYQTFEFDGDVSTMALRERDLAAVELDPLGDLTSQVGARVYVPSLPPPGFVLEAVELVTLSPGREFVKFAYTDGLERAYFLHQVDRSQASPQPSTSVVNTVPFGKWNFALCRVSGVEVVVAGKVPEHYLLELIQSAIH